MDLVVLCKRDMGMQGPRISFWPAAGARKLALVSTVLNSLVRPENYFRELGCRFERGKA